jgi:hypothetical protein
MQGMSTAPPTSGMGITTPPNIPESITILARDLQLLDNKHPMLSKEECDQLSALQAILNSRALLQCRMAREAEHLEDETWNLDTVSQLATLTKKLGRIPFQASPRSLQKKRATGEGPADIRE